MRTWFPNNFQASAKGTSREVDTHCLSRRRRCMTKPTMMGLVELNSQRNRDKTPYLLKDMPLTERVEVVPNAYFSSCTKDCVGAATKEVCPLLSSTDVK
jgi:hypothetical protein